MKRGLVIGVVVLVVLVAGFFLFGQSDDKLDSNVPDVSKIDEFGRSVKTVEISIINYLFNPEEVTINVGDTVIWTNKDSKNHTVNSKRGYELRSDELSKGESYSYTFNKEGEFDYHCILSDFNPSGGPIKKHTGKIVVNPAIRD